MFSSLDVSARNDTRELEPVSVLANRVSAEHIRDIEISRAETPGSHGLLVARRPCFSTLETNERAAK